MHKQHEKDHEALFSEVLLHHQQLKTLVYEQGDTPLHKYYSELLATKGPQISEFALSSLIALANNYVSKDLSEKISKIYKNRSVIDTAIHGGLITEPQSFQAATLQAYAARKDEVLIILACTAVRLNTQTFPRGVIYKGKRYPLFKNDDEQKLTYSCPPLTKDLVDKFAEKTKKAGVDTGWLLSTIDNTPELFDGRFNRFVEQATLLDKRLLKKAYSEISDMPEVLILPLEDLTTKLLLESFSKKDMFYRMIFEENMRNEALTAFDDIQGAWRGSVGGNHFFVGQNEKGDQTALIVQDGKLIGRDRDFSLSLDPESITEALISKRIAPGVFLSLQLLILHGITPSGAYFQIRYLPEMMKRMHFYLKKYCCTCDWVDRINSELLSYGGVFSLAEDGEPSGIYEAINNPKIFAKDLIDTSLTLKESLINNAVSIHKEVMPKN